MITFEASELQGFAIDLSDREIYNDIRAECDLTEILTLRPDATPEFFDSFKADAWAWHVLPHSQLDIIATADPNHSNIVWKNVVAYGFSPVTILGWAQGECEALGGDWRYSSLLGETLCMLPQSLVDQDVSWEIIARNATSCIIRITNDSDYEIRGVWYIEYLALPSEKRYQKLRAINEASIAKYGRRVMDLEWPLGQHPTMMQSMIEGYCERYCEPICTASVRIEGKNDDLIEKILSLKIDDKHEFMHPGLEMTEQFFINNVDVHHDVNAVIEGIYDLEQVRDNERTTLFILDSSLLDSDDVLAW
jgi:hypothetical protein